MNAYQEQLNELFEEQDEVQLIRQDERWAVRDMSAALWVDGILFEKEQKIEELTTIYNERKEKMIQKLDEWLEQSVKPIKNDIEFFETHLKVYQANVIAEERAKGAKKESKTIKLTYRDLKLTKQQPEITKDDEKLTKWVEDNHSSLVPYNELRKLLEEKDEKEEYSIAISELLEIVKKYDSEYIKRDPKLSWGELKKTLKQEEVKIVVTQEDGIEVVTGKRLVYFNEYGQEVPHVVLTERGEEYSVKAKK